MGKKKLTEFRLKCSCGAMAPIFRIGDKFMGHCAGCGSLTFWGNPALVERLRYHDKICTHELEKKACKGGFTTWCPRCRVRSFYYQTEYSGVEKNGSASK